MKKCLIIGKTNVGKTLFAINFAQYLGISKLRLTFEGPRSNRYSKEYSIIQAKNYLSDTSNYKTRCLQYYTLDIPVGKGIKRVDIVDSSGLSDGIHSDGEIRRGMSQTLAMVRDADIIFHMIDCSCCKVNQPSSMGEIDYQLAQLGQIKENYVILGNKMDLLSAREGIAFLRNEFPSHYIIPISALLKQGFNEVKEYVIRVL